MRPCARYVRRRCFCAWLTWMCEMNSASTSRPLTCVQGAQSVTKHSTYLIMLSRHIMAAAQHVPVPGPRPKSHGANGDRCF